MSQTRAANLESHPQFILHGLPEIRVKVQCMLQESGVLFMVQDSAILSTSQGSLCPIYDLLPIFTIFTTNNRLALHPRSILPFCLASKTTIYSSIVLPYSSHCLFKLNRLAVPQQAADQSAEATHWIADQ